MNGPRLDLAAIAPIAFTGVGALIVLLGEVWLSRRKTFLGRAVTEVWIGVYPSPFLRRLDASVGDLLHQMEQKKTAQLEGLQHPVVADLTVRAEAER